MTIVDTGDVTRISHKSNAFQVFSAECLHSFYERIRLCEVMWRYLIYIATIVDTGFR